MSDSNTQTNVNSGPVTTATLPYRIRGTSETIACILQPYNIHVAHKPITTLQCLLTNVHMSRTKTNQRTDREQYTRSKLLLML